MSDLYLKDKAYKIIGCCMEVHKFLGKGHSEVIYADALEYEFKKNGIHVKEKRNLILVIKKLYCLTIIMQIL